MLRVRRYDRRVPDRHLHQARQLPQRACRPRRGRAHHHPSDVPERIVAGQFTRYTLNIVVHDAYLYDIRVRDNVHVEEVYITNDEFSRDKPISD